MVDNLINYELTDEGKAYLPKEEGHPQGRLLVLPKNKLGDPSFSCRGGNLRDYHCAEILKRKDGKGARFVKEKVVKKDTTVKK